MTSARTFLMAAAIGAVMGRRLHGPKAKRARTIRRMRADAATVRSLIQTYRTDMTPEVLKLLEDLADDLAQPLPYDDLPPDVVNDAREAAASVWLLGDGHYEASALGSGER